MKNAYVRTAEETGLKPREGQEKKSLGVRGGGIDDGEKSAVEIRHDRG